MDRSRSKRIVLPLVMCVLALGAFSRTPGAETIRWVQILLLLVAGICAGVVLTALFKIRTPATGPASGPETPQPGTSVTTSHPGGFKRGPNDRIGYPRSLPYFKVIGR